MQYLNAFNPYPKDFRFLWILLLLFFMVMQLQTKAQGNYNPNNAPAWLLRGNAIQGDMWLGTTNNRGIHFKTNKILAAKFDSLRNLYLYQVDDDPAPDSVLTISGNRVYKAPYYVSPTFLGAQNGLNTLYGPVELGGTLIRQTQIYTSSHYLQFIADVAKPNPASNVNFYARVPNDQATTLYNLNNQMNLGEAIFGGQTKAYTVNNTINEIALPKASWANNPIINNHNIFSRLVPDSIPGTVNNAINGLFATAYETWGPNVPQIVRMVDIWAGHRVQYAGFARGENKFNTRVHILINGLPDTTLVTRSADILLAPGSLSVNSPTIPTADFPNGNWGIFQYNKLPNRLNGVTTFDNTSHIRLPIGTTAQRPGTPATAQIRYNSDSTALELYNGAWQKVLAFTQQPAIANPAGGSVIDVEARAAIVDILTALRNVGIIAP